MNFDDIYREYYMRIMSYCYAKLKDRKLAEDCAQDVFLAFHKKMPSLKLTVNIEGWLYKAAKYQVMTYNRKQRNDIPLETLTDENQPYSDDVQPEENIFDGIINDDEFKTLSEFYISGESIETIAKNNRLSTTGAYQRIRRIKQKILQNADKLHKYNEK
ncbi:MAG: RNA polymerase sigma factor [Huintestinicola sp.]